MDSLLERIEENKLDALYLFINEPLRDRLTFDVFLQNLLQVLPHNWSIQRVEVGHEFMSMVRGTKQDELLDWICRLESLRTLIVSDGYVPRKDNGTIRTAALLQALPRARNLINLDLQRLQLSSRDHVQMLADVFESLTESLEEIRITGLVVDVDVDAVEQALATSITTRGVVPSDDDDQDDHPDDDYNDDVDEDVEGQTSRGPSLGILDGPIEQCSEMSNLRSLAISQKQQQSHPVKSLVSQPALLTLCRQSTTLQDLSLRNMNMNDDTCQTLAQALMTNSFLTSLDLRQNESITDEGYAAILHALERNYDLWCTVMVDNDSFQAKFNALIELNQANRGDLVRHLTRDKLATFVGTLNHSTHSSEASSAASARHHPHHGDWEDPTSLWYFLSIHDTILYPLVNYLQWKASIGDKTKKKKQQRPREGQSPEQKEEEEASSDSATSAMAIASTSGTTAEPGLLNPPSCLQQDGNAPDACHPKRARLCYGEKTPALN